MTKFEAMKFLTEAATIKEAGDRLDKEAGGIFCGFDSTKEIHLTEKGFLQIADALQATVTFNPNWCERYPKHTEGSTRIKIAGKQWRVFALLDKGGKSND